MTDSSAAALAGFRTIREGRASIYASDQEKVFYNPTQIINRDLSTLVVTQFCKDRLAERPQLGGARLLDAHAASGLRGLRYVREIPSALLAEVISNDRSSQAIEAMYRSKAQNGPSAARLNPRHADANDTMREHASYYDVIDLDPYGAPTGFIDSAISATVPGGLLCVTSTDLKVLCSEALPAAAYQRYNGVPVSWPGSKETAIRLCLGSIAAAAARVGRTVEPLLCSYYNHYLRCFVRVYDKPAIAQLAAVQTGAILICKRCGAAAEVPNATCHDNTVNPTKFGAGGPMTFPAATSNDGHTACGLCGARPHVVGGTWIGPLHEGEFIGRLLATLSEAPVPEDAQRPAPFAEDGTPLLATRKQLRALLNISAEELAVTNASSSRRRTATDHRKAAVSTCTVWDCNELGYLFGLSSVPRARLCLELMDAGNAVASTHTIPTGFKTTAPPRVVVATYAGLLWAQNPEKVRGVLKRGLREPQSTREGLAARLLLTPRAMTDAEASSIASVLGDARDAEPLPFWTHHVLNCLPPEIVATVPTLQEIQSSLLAHFDVPQAWTTRPPYVVPSRECLARLPYYLRPRRQRRRAALWTKRLPGSGPKTTTGA